MIAATKRLPDLSDDSNDDSTDNNSTDNSTDDSTYDYPLMIPTVDDNTKNKKRR